jgi:hypothetical protein
MLETKLERLLRDLLPIEERIKQMMCMVREQGLHDR